MGCVYSNHSGSSRKKPNSANGDLNNDTSNEPVRWNANGNGNNHANDNNNNSQSSNRCRIFDVEVTAFPLCIWLHLLTNHNLQVCNVDKEGTTVIHGKIEISDNSLIYRLKGRSPIIWPLRFLFIQPSRNVIYLSLLLDFYAHMDMIKIYLVLNVAVVVPPEKVMNC